MLTKGDVCRMAGITIEELESGDSSIRLAGVTDELPEGLCLYELTLEDCRTLTCLPADLRVRCLKIIRCPNLHVLPDQLLLDELLIEDSEITALPENFSCAHRLILNNCSRLCRIPRSCIAFAEDLVIRNCRTLSYLPDIRIVFGNLDISGTSISALPGNLKIGGRLSACGSSLKTLPAGIRIGGDVDLSNCKKLESLPEGLTVNGNLNLAGSAIGQLPGRLTVGGILNLFFTAVQTLPVDLRVGASILGMEGAACTMREKQDFPTCLRRLIWRNSGYFQYENALYRVIAQGENYWKVLDSYTVVSLMLERNDVCLEDDLYIVTDGRHSYGMGNSLQEAHHALGDGNVPADSFCQ